MIMNQTSNNSNTLATEGELYPALIQCFFIISAGYIAGQLNLLTSHHAIGVSRYVSYFALPALIFKSLVGIQFHSVSWQFLTSVLVSKSAVFFLTMILTFIAERPRNFANIGEYAIMTTQSNDFPLISPIIDAVYGKTHPEYSRYVYLIAPISLIILNPIGFVLIELQKRLDDQRRNREKSWTNFQIVATVFSNISRNPLVLSSVFGVLFNFICKQQLPHIMDYVLTPIAQSFTGTALFYLGLTMVGKLSSLRAQLVITVLLLSTIKLIIFPLILRQAVFFLVRPLHNDVNCTLEYSNLGFLYGTAPTAPSVIFYVPESNLALQAVASTGLVVSTLLSGPIILVSAKMIHLEMLDTNISESYETLINKTEHDVSILSLVGTIIVLIGFCLRRRWLKVSFLHKYTFIFVCLQMTLAIWTIATDYVKHNLLLTKSPILDIGSILIALTTRTWATSLSTALMLTVCYSKQLARRCWWIYHLLGWTLPMIVSLTILLSLSIDQSKEVSILGTGKVGQLRVMLSAILLGLCTLINTTNLLRIARRTYRLRRDSGENHSNRSIIPSTSTSQEVQPLIDDVQVDTESLLKEVKPLEADQQLFRHGILIVFLTVDAVICLSVLLWLILARDRNSIYYELYFFDTVFLYGQGIITFLVFALDAELFVPVVHKIYRLLRCCGFVMNCCRDDIDRSSTRQNNALELECKIRSEFIQHANMSDVVETMFNGKQFCQWLIANRFAEDEFYAQNYFQELIDKKQIVCINQNENVVDTDSLTKWYTFSK